MIDPNKIRQNPEYIKQIIKAGRSDVNKANIDKWLKLDVERTVLIKVRDERREERNHLSKGITGKPEQHIVNKVKDLKDEISKIEHNLSHIESEWQEILDWIPNIPVSEEAMPFGKEEDENPIDKVWFPELGYVYDETDVTSAGLPSKEGKVASQTVGNFTVEVPEGSSHWDKNLTNPKHHVDIGEGWLFDISQGAKASGTRFKYLINEGALLEFSLQQYVSQELIRRGFKYVIPPLMVKEKSLYGTSHFPEGIEQVYKLDMDNFEDSNQLYLVGSSEPTNFSLFIDKTIAENEAPIKMFAYTPCFRSEVGSWGRDVRGIKRVHQFSKIEMNAVCTKKQSTDIFKEFLSINEWLLQSLEIPYRLARKCTGDAGYHASAEQIDPEAWLPGQKEWMEVGTDTNTTDFQARRLNIKIKRKDGKKEFAHTVNDTGCPMERMIIAIIDNYQQADGSIKVPEVLVPFMGKEFMTR